MRVIHLKGLSLSLSRSRWYFYWQLSSDIWGPRAVDRSLKGVEVHCSWRARAGELRVRWHSGNNKKWMAERITAAEQECKVVFKPEGARRERRRCSKMRRRFSEKWVTLGPCAQYDIFLKRAVKGCQHLPFNSHALRQTVGSLYFTFALKNVSSSPLEGVTAVF